jgi:hypothetical protein
MLLALTIAAAVAAEPTPAPPPIVPTPEAEARGARAQRHRRLGTAALVGGTAATAGGLVVLLVGRGRPGELSKESQAVSDVRSIGGAGLVITGLTVGLVGGSEIGKARALERGQVAALAPVLLPSGAGLALVVAGF